MHSQNKELILGLPLWKSDSLLSLNRYLRAITLSAEGVLMNANSTLTLRRGITALGLLAIAAVHILDLPSKWQEVRYLGVGYVVVIITSLVLAERLITKKNIMDFYIATLLSAGVIAGFTLTRTVGLPGAMDDRGNWLEPIGLVSLIVEALVVWNSLRAAQDLSQPASIKEIDTRNYASAA